MANDPLLRDAVKAIKQKVQNAAADSTAEELAYLATAVERIGGRGSLLEMEELGDVKMAEFTVLAGQTQKGVTDAIEAKRVATETSINTTTTAANQSMNDTKAAAVQTVNTTVTNGQKAINDTRDAAVTTMADKQTSTIAAVTKAANDAATAANNLVLTPAKLFFLCQN
jgi:hypothetical protein